VNLSVTGIIAIAVLGLVAIWTAFAAAWTDLPWASWRVLALATCRLAALAAVGAWLLGLRVEWTRATDRVDLVVVADRSASVSETGERAVEDWLQRAKGFGPAGEFTLTGRSSEIAEALDLARAFFTGRGEKRILLISDGKETEVGTDYSHLLSALERMQVTLSTIGVGLSTNARLLNTLAYAGKGRYRHVGSLTEIPAVVLQEAKNIESQLLAEVPLAARQLEDDPALAGIDSCFAAKRNRRGCAAAPDGLQSLAGSPSRVDAARHLAEGRAAPGPDALRARPIGRVPFVGHLAVGTGLDGEEAGRQWGVRSAAFRPYSIPRIRAEARTTNAGARRASCRRGGGLFTILPTTTASKMLALHLNGDGPCSVSPSFRSPRGGSRIERSPGAGRMAANSPIRRRAFRR